MKKFKQMSKSDRIKMEALLNAGLSKAAVAEQLHFHRSTIYREYDKGKYMHRNSDYTEEERYSSDFGYISCTNCDFVTDAELDYRGKDEIEN